jgi:hypothetical protein
VSLVRKLMSAGWGLGAQRHNSRPSCLWLPFNVSTPIEFSLPFHSHPHHPSSTISSLIAACYERHDFSLHCIQEQFLATPSHLSARPDSNPDSTPDTPQFALGHLRYTPSSPLFTANLPLRRLFPPYSHPPSDIASQPLHGYSEASLEDKRLLFLALGVDACCDSN